MLVHNIGSHEDLHGAVFCEFGGFRDFCVS